MVKPKKYLGQHFLKDENIAFKIVEALTGNGKTILEIGPGTGVLTKYLVEEYDDSLFLVDVDKESIDYLRKNFDMPDMNIIHADYLKEDLSDKLGDSYAIIGNFPYNISSQIFFKVLEEKDKVTEVVCMLQKEVARRLASPPGSKEYGILSVLLQAYFDFEYLFTVPPEVFNPPPKVNSGVIRLLRNNVESLECDEVLFKKVVKQGFQNRRKTLRNALKPLNLPEEVVKDDMLNKRAEALSVSDFVELTKKIEKWSR